MTAAAAAAITALAAAETWLVDGGSVGPVVVVVSSVKPVDFLMRFKRRYLAFPVAPSWCWEPIALKSIFGVEGASC